MNQKKIFIYITFCLVLTVGFLHLFYQAQIMFSPEKALKTQNESLQIKIEKEKLKTALVQNQLLEQQQEFAQWIPEKDIKKTSIRQIASVLRSDVVNNYDLDFPKIQRHFSEKKFAQVIILSKNYISKNSFSLKLPEVYFLLAESYYLTNEKEMCLDVISKMLDLYPENLLTGFILMRQAQIYADRGEKNMANDIFDLISDNFSKEKDLLIQVATLKRAMQL